MAAVFFDLGHEESCALASAVLTLVNWLPLAVPKSSRTPLLAEFLAESCGKLVTCVAHDLAINKDCVTIFVFFVINLKWS